MNDHTELSNCETHGTFVSRQYDDEATGTAWTACPQCPEGRRQAQEMEEQRRRQLAHQREWIARVLRNEIPTKYAAADFDGIEHWGIRLWTEACLAGESVGPLVIVGSPGVGKTHAAAAVLKHVIEATGEHGRFTTAADFVRRIRATWSRASEQSESKVLACYAEASFLVLDDLGAGRSAEVEIQDLISRRYDCDLMAQTIVCTNIAPANFNHSFGERVADRLREHATLVPLIGKSRRQPALARSAR